MVNPSMKETRISKSKLIFSNDGRYMTPSVMLLDALIYDPSRTRWIEVEDDIALVDLEGLIFADERRKP